MGILNQIVGQQPYNGVAPVMHPGFVMPQAPPPFWDPKAATGQNSSGLPAETPGGIPLPPSGGVDNTPHGDVWDRLGIQQGAGNDFIRQHLGQLGGAPGGGGGGMMNAIMRAFGGAGGAGQGFDAAKLMALMG